MNESLALLFNLSVFIFVLTSMFGLGLNLLLKQVLDPLRNVSLVLRGLGANFILVPILAFLIVQILGLSQEMAIGLFILSVAGGAPMLAKYAEMAKGDLAFTLGLMVLLQVVTIIVAPLVLPLLLADVQIDVLGMIQSLVTMMLVPLAAGLLVRARYESLAATLRPYMSQASSLTLMMQIVLGLVLGFGHLLGSIGSGVFLAGGLLTVGSLLIGYFLGGPRRETKIVMGLGTSQRNVSAAMLITVQNFAQPQVIVTVLVGALLMMVINSIVAGEFGRSGKADTLIRMQ